MSAEPAHALSQFDYISRNLGRVHLRGAGGLYADFDAPFAVWHAPDGLDAAYPATRHATLTCLHARTLLTRVDKPGRGLSGGAGRTEVVLYAGGYDRHYVAHQDASCSQLYLGPDLIRACGDDIFGTPEIELRPAPVFVFDSVLRRSVEAYVARGLETVLTPTRLEMNARALLLALHLVRGYSTRTRPKPRAGHGLSPRQLGLVLERIEAGLDGALRIEELADAAGLPVSAFFAAFRRSIGTTPHAYLTERRIARAKSLMRGRLSLAEIAIDCGFASQQHLCGAFRAATGTSPGAWRRALRGNV